MGRKAPTFSKADEKHSKEEEKKEEDDDDDDDDDDTSSDSPIIVKSGEWVFGEPPVKRTGTKLKWRHLGQKIELRPDHSLGTNWYTRNSSGLLEKATSRIVKDAFLSLQLTLKEFKVVKVCNNEQEIVVPSGDKLLEFTIPRVPASIFASACSERNPKSGVRLSKKAKAKSKTSAPVKGSTTTTTTTTTTTSPKKIGNKMNIEKKEEKKKKGKSTSGSMQTSIFAGFENAVSTKKMSVSVSDDEEEEEEEDDDEGNNLHIITDDDDDDDNDEDDDDDDDDDASDTCIDPTMAAHHYGMECAILARSQQTKGWSTLPNNTTTSALMAMRAPLSLMTSLDKVATVHDGEDWFRWVSAFKLFECLGKVLENWGSDEFESFQASLQSKKSCCDIGHLLQQTSGFPLLYPIEVKASEGKLSARQTQKYAKSGFRDGVAVCFATFFGLLGENWPSKRVVDESDIAEALAAVIPFTIHTDSDSNGDTLENLTSSQLERIRFTSSGLIDFLNDHVNVVLPSHTDTNTNTNTNTSTSTNERLQGIFRHFFLAGSLYVLSMLVTKLLFTFSLEKPVLKEERVTTAMDCQ